MRLSFSGAMTGRNRSVLADVPHALETQLGPSPQVDVYDADAFETATATTLHVGGRGPLSHP